MRVQYTLPGFLPDPSPAADSAELGESLFRSKLNVPVAQRWLDWGRLLRLDRPPSNAAQIGPPPKPPGLEVADAASERLRWRQMLDGQTGSLENFQQPTGEAAGTDVRAIGRMLALLLRFQELEDGVVARHLSEAES
jgi:hypothetical protein